VKKYKYPNGLAAVLESVDRNPTWLARQLDTSRQNVARWAQGERKLTVEWAKKIAPILNTTPDRLLLVAVGENLPLPKVLVPVASGLIHRTGDLNFPIYSAAQGGDGFDVVSADVMEWIRTPGKVAGVPGAYGILIRGTSMIPRFEPGEIALVHPRRPPENNAEVVLYHGEGNTRALIRRLVTVDDIQYRLEQFNPPKIFSVERIAWPTCHLVVGRF